MGNACSEGRGGALGKRGLGIKKDINISECKVVILGDTAVGKTSIAVRYLENKFTDSHIVTLGAQFQQPRIQLQNGNTLKLNLWDTAGEEKFRSMLPMYYKSAKAAILTYDIGNRNSFESVDYWIEALSEHVKAENTVLLLVGNKKDLEADKKQVDTAIAQEVARKNGMFFLEVSAKTGENVNELFSVMAEELSKRFKF